MGTCKVNVAITGYTWSGEAKTAYWKLQFPLRKCTREISVRWRLKHTSESLLSPFAWTGKLSMVPRWKLQCASTGVLIIPGIWSTPLRVAADMSRCNAFFFFLTNKKFLLSSYWKGRRQWSVMYLLGPHKLIFSQLLDWFYINELIARTHWFMKVKV